MENNPITWNEGEIPFCFVLIKLTNAPLSSVKAVVGNGHKLNKDSYQGILTFFSPCSSCIITFRMCF
jgi:hypothetical protein